ncbi:hypothetical protein [Geomonas azotofigens]|uniref:hypothetical protein n=1 Tax=Geomonas azotofigens TaxID=2843196 RepID=UPI001C0FFFA8|nr:hypothetical protein [Geomonas azotofigens]MBU5614701.1 hypothetical protein [Geomonas azotofigens]
MIHETIKTAFETASKIPLEPAIPKKLHAARARCWVESLAAEFRKEFGKPDWRVFSIDCDENKKEFRRNEFLFDITVSRVDFITSPVHAKSIPFMTDLEWAVESEFSGNTRNVIDDFNKLVVARSKNKLMVIAAGPREKDVWETLRPCAAAATFGGARVFLAAIPHPRHWNSESLQVTILEFKATDGLWV